MNSVSKFRALIASIALCGVAVAPMTAQAQFGQGDRRGDSRYDREWNIRSLVDRAERSSNAFRQIVERRDAQFDDRRDDRRDDDRRREEERRRREEERRRRGGSGDDDLRRDQDRWMGNGRRGDERNRDRFFDELEPRVQRMDEAFERLRKVASNDDRRRGRTEMAAVLRYAREVDRYFYGNTFGRRNDDWGNGRGNNGRGNGNGRRNDGWRRDEGYTYNRSGTLNSRWSTLRNDINALARAYGLEPINGSGIGRRGY